MNSMWRWRRNHSGWHSAIMILEALNFVTSLLTSARRDPKEINASVRLWARARRCAREWAPHETNCKDFVQSRMPTRGRVAVVLGSGLLRDVPIGALSKAFDEVRLYDLQHLASVRLWALAKGFRNLHFLHRDLSTGLGFLADDPRIDLVISANLLSQIGIASERAGQNTAVVLARHVAELAAAPGQKLLLTDVSFGLVLKSGMVVERTDLMHGVTLPAPDASWPWTVAPIGELDPAYRAVHHVVAVALDKRIEAA
jgi:hypothetical protein